MGKHHATISINGRPFLSYVPIAGLITSPSTIPWAVVDVLGRYIFGDQVFATGWRLPDPITCEETAPNVFTNRARVILEEGARVDTNHVTYCGTRRFEVEWEGVDDYSETPDRGSFQAHRATAPRAGA